MTYKIFQEDNRTPHIFNQSAFDLVYADMIYEDKDIMSWLGQYCWYLREGGIYIIHTDWHTDWLVRYYFATEPLLKDCYFVNHLVWKNEWGNHPKDRFHQCFDSILVYSKGSEYRFYSERVQVEKVTKSKGLNPSGRETKTATAWVDDVCLTTTAIERVKKADGHLIRWQKPLRLFDRIIAPFTDVGDWICDPFMGSGSLGEWCLRNSRHYMGVENDSVVYGLAKERLEKVQKDL